MIWVTWYFIEAECIVYHSSQSVMVDRVGWSSSNISQPYNRTFQSPVGKSRKAFPLGTMRAG